MLAAWRCCVGPTSAGMCRAGRPIIFTTLQGCLGCPCLYLEFIIKPIAVYLLLSDISALAEISVLSLVVLLVVGSPLNPIESGEVC